MSHILSSTFGLRRLGLCLGRIQFFCRIYLRVMYSCCMGWACCVVCSSFCLLLVVGPLVNLRSCSGSSRAVAQFMSVLLFVLVSSLISCFHSDAPITLTCQAGVAAVRYLSTFWYICWPWPAVSFIVVYLLECCALAVSFVSCISVGVRALAVSFVYMHWARSSMCTSD